MTTSEAILTEPPSTPRRRSYTAVWFIAAALVLVTSLVLTHVTLNSYYALVPGYAQPVSPLISVPKAQSHAPHGKVLLTDVGVQETVNLIDYLVFYRFGTGDQLIKSDELTGDLPVSEFNGEGVVDMEESQMTAEEVALRQLGIPVPEHDAGVTVYAIDPGSPAWKKLQIGDVVTKVGSFDVSNPSQLQSAIRSYSPGDTVPLEVGSVEHPTSDHTVVVKLASIREHVGVAAHKQYKTYAFLGLGDPEGLIAGFGTQPSYDFPFAVKISSDGIGGPSAGLAWTLGIIDSLVGGDLTGGKTIAATGTIDPDGSVGEVGGVEQKTVAVERAGAKLFLVPSAEVSTAKSVAGSGLKVVGIESLAGALRAIQQDGGHLGKAASGPPPGPGGASVPTDWPSSPWS